MSEELDALDDLADIESQASSSEEEKARPEPEPEPEPPRRSAKEEALYSHIDVHAEKVEQHDASLAAAQAELAAEIERGRAKKRAIVEKQQRAELLAEQARKNAVAKAKASRRQREAMRRQRVLDAEQRERDEYARAVWAATRIQSGYRGRRR